MNYPFLKQPDSMDCGPACISMVAKHYGKDFSLDTLRKTCHISREGVSLLGISEAAESIGFKTLGGRFTFEKLANEAPLPCIVHWEQEHFVVVYKIKSKNFPQKNTKVFVADPGKGLIAYSEEEFLQHWISTRTNNEDKGVALLLEPTPAFFAQKGEKQDRNSLKFGSV